MSKYQYGGNDPQNIDLSDTNYNINILFGLIVAGFMTLLYDYGWAEIVGYSIITFSVLMIFFLTMGFSSRKKMTNSTFKFALNVLKQGFPIVIILFLLSWVITINLMYYNNISHGDVPIEYSGYARHAAWLFILLMYLLYVFAFKYIDPENHKDKVSKYSPLLIVLVGSVTFWVLSIMQLILRYYLTDG